MLIDEVKIKVKAGDGGDGMMHFYHDRHRPKGGPDGGEGGRGGAIFFEGVDDITALKQFRFKKKFSAESGEKGGINQRTGKDGEDMIFKIPIGTIVNYDNGTSVEIKEKGERTMIVKGGKGGKGNYAFRSSTNTTPKEFEGGEKKEWRSLFLQLKLIADVGLIGLPNAGKSSLLNELTKAKAKVASYPFTTLEPNLGVSVGGKVIADIPGLIEGASSGKGLGFKFLKHVERTKLLVHCVPTDSIDPKKDYKIIREELRKYSSGLAKREEIVILTKSDLVDEKDIGVLVKKIGAKIAVSILDEESIKKLSDLIHKKLKQITNIKNALPDPSLYSG
ncbi:GTPase ObgE [Patescibacteria group bacterium]|nr:GTPase ObgE [Patescibacteria group bacterium]